MYFCVVTDLLKSIHCLGKSGDNSFSIIQKLSDLSLKGGNKEVQEHPAFGFKGNLIRLVGNLSYKHEANQDQVSVIDIKLEVQEEKKKILLCMFYHYV